LATAGPREHQRGRRSTLPTLSTRSVERAAGYSRRIPPPYYQRDGISIYRGDMRDVLPQIKAADLVVTDPPYVVGLASSAQDSGKVEGWADLMNAATWYGWWLREGRRLTAPGGAAWVFNSWRSFPALARGAWEARWPIESLLVWDKQAVGTGTRGLRPRYELVALSAHRRFKIPNRRLTDIHPCRWPAGRKPSGHPAGKPVPLLRHLIGGGQRSGFSTHSPARAPPWPPNAGCP
jgi:hypothetical protein